MLLAAGARVGARVEYVKVCNLGGINAIPGGELAVGPGGKLFGTTYGGAAADGTGSGFELVPIGNGMFACNTLYRFDTAGSRSGDGQSPFAGMTISPDGLILFGTTQLGGTGSGTAFEVNIPQAEMLPHNNGNGYTQLHDFNSATEGGKPQGRPLYVGDNSLAAAGIFLFGTAYDGGPSGDYGTIFSLDFSSSNTASNGLVVIFTGANGAHPIGKLWSPPANGVTPQMISHGGVGANVASNSVDLSTITLYGTTLSGGSNNWGTVYKVTANGSNFTTLHHFNFSTADGTTPEGGVVGAGNTLFGTTAGGGSNYSGTVFAINTDGTGFNLLGHFDPATTGSQPGGDLVLAGDTLYGTTYSGGTNGGGTVYSIKTNGSSFTVLHSFTTPQPDASGNYTNNDGGWSVAGLVLSSNVLYGTTPYGGANGVGVAYAIILPAAPVLNLTHTGGGLTLRWLDTYTNFFLQTNATLNSLSWSNYNGTVNDDGTNKYTVLPPASGKLFFRLLSTNGL